MPFIKKIKLFCIPFFVLVSFNLHAEEVDARIVKLQGVVYVLDAEGRESKVEHENFLVNRMDTVITREDGRAVVKFNDGTVSVLDARSSLRIEKTGWISQLGGKAYYIFNKLLGRQKSKIVKTSFASIGIRGTEFIVNSMDENQAIALREGKLRIESPDGEFEVHRKKPETDDFESFSNMYQSGMNEYLSEFESYQNQLEEEFVEYKKEFSLGSMQAVRFDKNRVDSIEFGSQLDKEFIDMRRFADQFINRDLETEDLGHYRLR